MMFQDFPAVPLDDTFAGASSASESALSLLDNLLALDPAQRLSASAALDHPYFTTGQPIAAPSDLPKPVNW
jgi:serine/threonine protein kinase